MVLSSMCITPGLRFDTRSMETKSKDVVGALMSEWSGRNCCPDGKVALYLCADW
jgi:hypothetical protein